MKMQTSSWLLGVIFLAPAADLAASDDYAFNRLQETDSGKDRELSATGQTVSRIASNLRTSSLSAAGLKEAAPTGFELANLPQDANAKSPRLFRADPARKVSVLKFSIFPQGLGLPGENSVRAFREPLDQSSKANWGRSDEFIFRVR
jgi:hypothetical protein